MINKQVSTPSEAIADVFDGATVMVGGSVKRAAPSSSFTP